MKKYLRVTMPDNSVWEVPVEAIIQDRATHYFSRDEHGEEYKTFEDAYKETVDLFTSDDFEIEDWAQNNMNWIDVLEKAILVADGEVDYNEGWINGEKAIVEH